MFSTSNSTSKPLFKTTTGSKSKSSNEVNNDETSILVDPIEDVKHKRRLAREAELNSSVDRKQLAIKQLLNLTLSLVINLALPLILYFTLRNRIGAVYALLISGIPPLLNVIYKFIKRRKVDAFGCLFVVAFVVSGVVSLITGDARVAVLRESIITGIIGIVFLFTMIPFHIGSFTNRPVLYLLLKEFYSEYPPTTWIDRDGNKHEEDSVNWLWNHYKPFKVYVYVNTSFNGIVLLCECAIRLILVLATSLSIDDIVKYGTIMIAIASSLLAIVSTVHYSMISKKLADFYHDWMDENDFSHEFKSKLNSSIDSCEENGSKTASIVKNNNSFVNLDLGNEDESTNHKLQKVY